MAKKVNPVARARLSIGGVTDAFTEAAVVADTYTRVAGIRNVPNFGDTYQMGSAEEVDEARVQKWKTTANAGSMEITCSRRRDDEGQIAVIEASRSDEAFNFLIELPIGGGQWERNYVTGYVMGRQKGNGGPQDSQTLIFTIELTEEPIELDPVTTP